MSRVFAQLFYKYAKKLMINLHKTNLYAHNTARLAYFYVYSAFIKEFKLPRKIIHSNKLYHVYI